MSCHLLMFICMCRARFLAPITVPGMYVNATTCRATLQPSNPNLGNRSVTSGPATNTTGLAAGPYSQFVPVPGWLAWLGEMGIGLPLLQYVDSLKSNVTVCYWSLNWGRIVLQNVTLLDVSPQSARFLFNTMFTVPETGRRTCCG
jgi:hypothetical protein